MGDPPPAKRQRSEVDTAPVTEADIYLVTQGVRPSNANTAAMRKTVKVTPLEQQVVIFKRKVAPHVLLFVACGYRMRLLGRDSRVASRRLGIMCIPNKPFENSSVPTGRVMFHAARLVGMGYIVGIVEQAESQAIRQEEGQANSGVFERKLGNLMSRATMISSAVDVQPSGGPNSGPEGGENDEVEDGPDAGSPCSMDGSAGAPAVSNLLDEASDRFMLFICESKGGASLGATAVSFVRGSAVYSDVIPNDPLRTGLVDIITTLNPVEIIVEEGISRETREKLHAALGLNEGPTDEGAEDAFRVPFISLPIPSSACVTELDARSYAMARDYLLPFGLSETFASFERRHLWEVVQTSTSSPSAMLLPGRTLANLEVLRCTATEDAGRTTNEGMRGSLLGHLNHCFTPFGFRKLRGWLLAPLLDLSMIEARQEAVRTLATDEAIRSKIAAFFRPPLKDLAAVLQRLSMARSAPAEYIAMLFSVSRVATAAQGSDGWMAVGAQSLRERIASITSSELLNEVGKKLSAINSDAVEPWQLFVASNFSSATALAPSAIHDLLHRRAEVEEELNERLMEARGTMKLSSLEYKTVLATPYLLEVPSDKERAAPKHWTVISRTKASTRFRTPEIDRLVVSLTANTERIRLAGLEAWEAEQKSEWGSHAKSPCRRLVQSFVDALAEFDALMSLGIVAQIPGYVCPKLLSNATGIRKTILRGVKHPMQAAMITDTRKGNVYVPNDVEIGEGDSGGTWILTGPNMGGKSALMRSVALVALMAQMGSFVPCEFAQLPLFSSIRTRMGSFDSLSASSFLVEMRETAAILNAGDLSTSLVLLDELGRGTSSYDGVAVADATLHFLVRSRATVLFVTHYPSLCALFRGVMERENPNVSNDLSYRGLVACKYMSYARRGRADGQTAKVRDCTESNEGEADDDIVLLYRAVDGVTPSSFGLSIAHAVRIPSDVIKVAKERSARCEAQSNAMENLYLLRQFLDQRP